MNKILNIKKRVFNKPWTREQLQNDLVLSVNSENWVYMEDQQVVGYILGWKVMYEFHLNNIAVHLVRWEPYGVGILLLVFFLDFFMHIGLLWGFVRPVANGIVWVFLGQPLL